MHEYTRLVSQRLCRSCLSRWPAIPAETFVPEWLELIGSGREKQCRSESLHRPDSEPIPRNPATSAPSRVLRGMPAGLRRCPLPGRGRVSRAQPAHPVLPLHPLVFDIEYTAITSWRSIIVLSGTLMHRCLPPSLPISVIRYAPVETPPGYRLRKLRGYVLAGSSRSGL